jgi:hypothetical protein
MTIWSGGLAPESDSRCMTLDFLGAARDEITSKPAASDAATAVTEVPASEIGA